LTKEIILTKGKVAIVDDEDYERLSEWKWHVVNGKYAARSVWDGKSKTKKMVLLHREVMSATDGFDVDHINLNTFDNRKANLRVVTHQDNCFNRPGLSKHSKHKGVYKLPNGSWASKIKVGEKAHNLGTYKSEIDAAKAYNVAALKLVGECAWLNDVDHTGFVLSIKETSSRYRGVSFVKHSKKWAAHVSVNKRKVCLGHFEDEHDAARMYNFWANDVYGNSARLNVIKEETK
jgi:hypothetical protein